MAIRAPDGANDKSDNNDNNFDNNHELMIIITIVLKIIIVLVKQLTISSCWFTLTVTAALLCNPTLAPWLQ